MDAKILVPIRYGAWLSGSLGQDLHEQLENGLAGLHDARVTRMPRGFLVEADEAPGPLLEAVHHAATELEEAAAAAFPIFYQEMGPVWTGTLQSLFA